VVEELGDRNVIVFEILGENCVQELNNGDVVVAEELSDSRVKVLEHCHDDVIRALAQILSHSNIVLSLVHELSNRDIIFLELRRSVEVFRDSDAIFSSVKEASRGSSEIFGDSDVVRSLFEELSDSSV